MLKSRPFHLVVTVLIALGMHICCCQVAMFSGGSDFGDESVETSLKTGLCGHEHGSHGEEGSPAQPGKAPHGCCGVHDKPLTSQFSKIDVPPLALVAILPVISTIVEPAKFDLTVRNAQCAAPAPETSLLQRHCALLV